MPFAMLAVEFVGGLVSEISGDAAGSAVVVAAAGGGDADVGSGDAAGDTAWEAAGGDAAGDSPGAAAGDGDGAGSGNVGPGDGELLSAASERERACTAAARRPASVLLS